MTPRRVFALITVGAIGGTLSGAFGVGGGIIMVPLLMWLVALDQRRASATSLVAIVPAAIAGSVSYFARGDVALIAAALIAAGGIAGSLVGAKLLRALPLGVLRIAFVGLLVGVAVRMLLELPSRGTDLALSPSVIVVLLVLGVVMGIAAGLFGIGGGIIVVPVLVTVFGVDDLVAKGTSLAAMIPAALTGSASHVKHRLVAPLDGIIVGLAATAASFGGVALAYLLPPRPSAILFAILVLIAAAQLTWRAWRQQRAR